MFNKEIKARKPIRHDKNVEPSEEPNSAPNTPDSTIDSSSKELLNVSKTSSIEDDDTPSEVGDNVDDSNTGKPEKTVIKESNPPEKPEKTVIKESNINLFSLILKNSVYIGIVVCIFAILLRFYTQKPIESAKQCTPLLQLASKYPTIDQLTWKILNVSVNRAIYHDPGEPATFIFLYNSSVNGEALLEDVTGITSKCFGDRKPIHLESKYFRKTEIIQNPNIFFEQYQTRLKEEGILVVRDLDQIPGSAAQVFFTICDSVESLINKAVIFFTINISHQPTSVIKSKRNPTQIAEDILKQIWSTDLNSNELNPLVVRLTENVFKID
ncbi:uncharacterized protein LOC131437443 [Malaya genurostris]|uniref:uncharacterized protein LOC131437443 n=1 Tax=Malaya genurostris TaxID=325434 RepID=UPI0026F3B366|nr:uncharacterized protein LOC131437443 [Malaya genurostris]